MTPVILMGGAVSPKAQHETIRMDSEQVTIRLKQNSYTVDAVFKFFNSGQTTIEWVGFPKQGNIWTSEFVDVSDFIRFATWIDGRKTDVIEERGQGRISVLIERAFQYLLSAGGLMGVYGLGFRPIAENRWLVQRVTFPAHTNTTIRTSYEARYVFRGAPSAYYIVGTGRFWKGSIGKAVFLVDATDVGGTGKISVEGLEIGPGPRFVSKNVALFEMRNIEPPISTKLTINVMP
ncbi:MAG: hypothetical protein AB1473_18475 [Thermodesulfobacteriota bacterium]